MAEILDNEEITAETLNEISIDLGYEELKFSANEKFGNDKLNAITGDLVSKGILCKDNRCKCTLTDNRITVNTGVIVFENGSKKRITESVTLDVLEGGTNYIYAKNDTSNGKIYLTNSLTEPTGDYVPLCTVTDGVLTDERKIANAKVNLNATKVQEITIEELLTVSGANNVTKQIKIPVTGDDFNFIIAHTIGGQGVSYFVYDIKKGTSTGIGRYTYRGSSRPTMFSSGDYLLYDDQTPSGSSTVLSTTRMVSLENGILTLELYSEGYQSNLLKQTLILC